MKIKDQWLDLKSLRLMLPPCEQSMSLHILECVFSALQCVVKVSVQTLKGLLEKQLHLWLSRSTAPLYLSALVWEANDRSHCVPRLPAAAESEGLALWGWQRQSSRCIPSSSGLPMMNHNDTGRSHDAQRTNELLVHKQRKVTQRFYFSVARCQFGIVHPVSPSSLNRAQQQLGWAAWATGRGIFQQ